MPLFGRKKQNMDTPEVVDFSNDTWSYKGEPPSYQIQSDGFSYDVVDADGNDKNAISLGISGMLVIVLNAKSPKIREDEILPPFGKIIKTRNWHSMTVKEANFLVQTAIKKLSSSAMSGDVFDLASYAPLEIKRVLLKTLFTIARMQMKPEFREEAEHRIIDDIVPEIFAHPDYELAQLTGLIVKPDPAESEPVSKKIETSPVLDRWERYSGTAETTSPVAASEPEPDSAFAELQKIYGRKSDSAPVREAVREAAAKVQAPAEPVSSKAEVPSVPSSSDVSAPGPKNPFAQAEPKSMPQGNAAGFSAPQPANPFAQAEPKSMPQGNVPGFSVPQPNNPFSQTEPRSIPQPAMPNFGMQQPNNPFAQADTRNIPQPPAPNIAAQQPNAGIPQPPMPNFGMQPNPYGGMNPQGNVPMQNQGFPQQGGPYGGNVPPYPGQMWQQNPQMMQNMPNPNMPPYPGQMRQMPPQNQQNMGGYPQNSGITQNSEGMNVPPGYPVWMNRQQMPQQPQQNNPNSENA